MTNISASPLRQPNLEAVAVRLGPFESTPMSPAWTDILRIFRGHAGVGEVRDPVDWAGLPTDKPLRIVYLIDESGPVLRWLLPEDRDAERAVGGVYHDYLERGDGQGKAMSGWLLNSPDGVRVWP